MIRLILFIVMVSILMTIYVNPPYLLPLSIGDCQDYRFSTEAMLKTDGHKSMVECLDYFKFQIKSINQCNKMKSQFKKDACKYVLAMNNNDSSLCASFSTKISNTGIYPFNSMIPASEELEWKDICYHYLSLKTNENYCVNITNRVLRRECVLPLFPQNDSLQGTWTKCLPSNGKRCTEICGERSMHCTNSCISSSDKTGYGRAGFINDQACENMTEIRLSYCNDIGWLDESGSFDSARRCCCASKQ